MDLDISVVILTYNEEIHIRRCIERILPLTRNIYVVDSFSTDNTLSFISAYDFVQVFQNKWENNHAKQMNWALKNLPFRTKWILRLDADEYLTDNLISELKTKLPYIENDISGIVFKRRHYFLGKWVKKGVYPVKLLRLFQYNVGYCEDRMMDEHIIVKYGRVVEFESDFVDENLQNLMWWISKHNNYATKEAAEILKLKYKLKNVDHQNEENFKNIYIKFPLFFRAIIYFIIRYVFKLGFLEGKNGLLWHFLQGLWYRMLVDARIYEIESKCFYNRDLIKRFLEDNHNITFD